MLEFYRSLYICNHLSESIHSWTKDTLPYRTLSYRTLPYRTVPYPAAYATLHYPTHTLPFPTLPYPTPYSTLPLLYPTLPFEYPYLILPSHSQATLSCDSSYLAHLSRRLIGELIGYPCSGVRPSVHNFNNLLLHTACPIKPKFYME